MTTPPLAFFPGVAGPAVRPLTASTALPIPAQGAGVTLPGNFLGVPDSDFRSPPTGNWTGNGCTVTTSTSFSFSGGLSLMLTATRPGTISVSFASNFPAVANAGYIMSGYALATTPNVTGQCSLEWFNRAGVPVSTFSTPFVPLAAGSFVPLAGAAGAPGNAALFNPFFLISGMLTGQSVYLDLLYVAVSPAQILIAWGTQPGSTTPQFADMTPFTRGDPPISMTRGRQDNLSEVQPGQLTLTLADDLGWFTPQKSGSPFYPNVKIGRRIQVNLADETGTFHTRFDGQLNEIDYAPAPTGLTMDAAVTAADVMSLLSRQPALSSWTRQEILLDNPSLHWTLDDAAGSSTASESSGNGGPPLQIRSFGGPPTTGSPPGYAFAGGTGASNGVNNGMESQTWVPGPGTPAAFPSVYFHQSLAGGQGNWQLQAAIPPIGTGAGQNTTIEGFLIPDVPNASAYATPGVRFYAFSLASTRTGTMVAAVVTNTDPGLPGGHPVPPQIIGVAWANFLITTPASQPGVSPGVLWHGGTPGPVAVAIVITGSATFPSATLYVGGVSQGSFSVPPGTVFNQVTCGGPIGGSQGWVGQLSCLSVYTYAVPASRLAVHAQRARNGMYAQQSGQVASALAQYAALPPFWQNFPSAGTGLSYLDYFALTGSNALAAMQQAEQAEGGLVWADAAGRLNFAGRELRMGAGAPQIALQSGQYETDLGYKVNDQYLSNTASVASAGIAAGSTAVNTQSLGDYGSYAPSGGPQSPTSLPLLTYNSWYQQSLNGTGGTVAAFSPDNLSFAAQWAANSHAQPGAKGTSVRIDMATLPAAGPDGIPPSQLYAVDVNSVVVLAGLPSQFPDTAVPNPNECFVEGVSETLGISESALTHDLTWYTSPASQGRAWIAGDPVYGQLDATATIGRSGPPAIGLPPPFESAGPAFPGPPYYPPTYSAAMNKTGFAGDLDQAGIWANLAQQLNPPLVIAAVAQAQQPIPNGLGQPGTRLAWDTVYCDTASGMGWLAGFPNWYFVLVPGWYQLYAVVNYAVHSAGRRAAWFLVAQQAATGGLGPGSSANIWGSADVPALSAAQGFAPCVPISAKVYCTLGTAIAVQTWQTSGGTLNTSLSHGGCMFAARFLGDTGSED